MAMTLDGAARYIRAIRNRVKRAYAVAYLAYRLGEGPEPADPRDLSYMAAQAVRMNLADFGH
jgi:hypothetical protein